MIEITSKREGFRRAGVAHSVQPTTWPDDAFTKKQLKELQVEKNLQVKVIKDKPAKDAE